MIPEMNNPTDSERDLVRERSKVVVEHFHGTTRFNVTVVMTDCAGLALDSPTAPTEELTDAAQCLADLLWQVDGVVELSFMRYSVSVRRGVAFDSRTVSDKVLERLAFILHGAKVDELDVTHTHP
jgi:hypothetical protein